MNPNIESLIEKAYPNSFLVVADRGFPSWPKLTTVDISLVDGIPTVLEVLAVLRKRMKIRRVIIAAEFAAGNTAATQAALAAACQGIEMIAEPHLDFKARVPRAVGLIRTGDTIQYANLIVEAA